MSTFGGGELILIPLAALGVAGVAAVAAAGAVVYAGGVVLVQAGKGLIACGRAVDDAVRCHAAQQRAIYAQCEAYEHMMLERAAHAAHDALARQAAERAAAAASRFRAAPPALPPLPDYWLAEPAPTPPETTTRLYTARDLRQWRSSLEQELLQTQAALAALGRAEWAGWVAPAPMQTRLQAIRGALAAQGESQAAISEAQNDLRLLRYELARLTATLQERAAQRTEAWQAITAGLTAYRTRIAEMAPHPEMVAAAGVAEDLLTRAEARFQAADLAGATQLARVAEQYLGQLSGSLAAARTSNFAVAIAALRRHVADYQFAGHDPAPKATLELIEEAEQALAGHDFTAAWQALHKAQDAVQRLDQEVVRRTHSRQQQSVLDMAAEVLRDMAYRPEAPLPLPDRSYQLVAKRQDGAAFHVVVSPHGLLRFKTEDFEGRQCEAETAEFFRRLRARGLQVEIHSQPALETAAARVREAILRSGATSIEQQVDPTGKGIELTAIFPTARQTPPTRHHIDYSGRVTRAATEPDATVEPLDDARYWTDEWQRQFAAAQAEQARQHV